MKKLLLAALALFVGTSMYAQEKTIAKLSVSPTSANVTSSDRAVTGDSQLTYSTGSMQSAIGVGGGSYIEWGVAFRPEMYTADDNFVTSVDFYSTEAGTYTLNIYDGEPTAAVPGNLLYTYDYAVTETGAWANLPIYNAVVEIDHTKALWIGIGTTDPSYPAAYSSEILTTTDCCMMYFQGEWTPVIELNPDFEIQPWMTVANTTSENPGVQCAAISSFPYFNDFENFLDEKDCWVSIDADGDGYDWLTGTEDWWNEGVGVGYSHALVSESYLNEGFVVLNADNYILTPEFNLPANKLITLSWAASASYQDYYEVLVAPNGSTEVSDFVLLFSDAPVTNQYVTQTADLTNYAGTTVRVVFRNQMSDGFIVTIDNLSIETAADCSDKFPFVENFDDNGLECWGNYDEDGDGYTWQLAAGKTGKGVQSESYGATGALTPDNWLVSPEITLPETLSDPESELQLVWYAANYSSYFPETYAVYVSTTGDQPSDFTEQLYYGQPGGSNFMKETVLLNDYLGQTIRIAFRHFDSNDNWAFTIDDVSVKEVAPVLCNPITDFPYFNDFEDFVDASDCWVSIDADGDGHDWITGTNAYWGAGYGYNNSNCLTSESYTSAGSLNADNYILSPEFVLPVEDSIPDGQAIVLSWYANSQDMSFPDYYEAFVAPNGSTEITDFVLLLGENGPSQWTQRYVDLSEYAGTTVRVVFRHKDSDKFRLKIDNLSIALGEMPEPPTCDPIVDFPYLNEFENFIAEEEHYCWISIDNDGDGYDWVTGTAYHWGSGDGVGGSQCLYSQSYHDFNEVSLNADNYLVSPEFALPATAEETLILSWYAGGGDHYEVMISPEGTTEITDFVSLLDENAPSMLSQRYVDLSEYAGKTVRVVFHHQDSGKAGVKVDNLSIYDGVIPDPISCDPITDFPYLEEFENFLPQGYECWTSIDADGDGHDWITGTNYWWDKELGFNGSNCIASQSYENYVGAYNADNYLVSPEIVLPTGVEAIQFAWYVNAVDPSYPDSYEVMISPNGSTEISDFVSLYSEIALTEWTERVVEITEYAGSTVRVVFHHQDYDKYSILIDNLNIRPSGEGVDENNSEAVAVYPNPVKNVMSLKGVAAGTEVRIYDITGSEVMSFVYEGKNINVENLANGVYVLRVNGNAIKFVK